LTFELVEHAVAETQVDVFEIGRLALERIGIEDQLEITYQGERLSTRSGVDGEAFLGRESEVAVLVDVGMSDGVPCLPKCVDERLQRRESRR
jgi:hypothetical protein